MPRLSRAAVALALAAFAAAPLAAQQTSDSAGSTDAPATTANQGSESSSSQSSESTRSAQDNPVSPATENLIRVTSLLDGSVYAASEPQRTEGDVGEPLFEVPADWREIGEIEDLALNPEGQLQGVVVEAGGFLGIGQSQVLVPADQLRSIRVGGRVYFLTGMSEDELLNLPKVDDTMWR